MMVLCALATSASADPDQQVRRRNRVQTAFIVGAGGAASFVTGLAFGLVARSRYQAAFDQGDCRGGQPVTICDPVGSSQTHDARTLGSIGTAFGAAGALALGAAAVLYWTAPSDVATVTPLASDHAAGVAVVGRF